MTTRAVQRVAWAFWPALLLGGGLGLALGAFEIRDGRGSAFVGLARSGDHAMADAEGMGPARDSSLASIYDGGATHVYADAAKGELLTSPQVSDVLALPAARPHQRRGAPTILFALRNATNAGSRLLSPSSLADEIASATGGVVKTNKGGFTVNVPNGSRGITIRVMEEGGGRTNYYRVSVPGKGTYTVAGQTSTDAALTHIPIGQSSMDDILAIVERTQAGG